MIVQLSNGKVITMSLEEYLGMSDEDFDNLTRMNIGSYCTDPFTGSSIKDKSKQEPIDFVFDEDVDDYATNQPIDLNNLPDEAISEDPQFEDFDIN